MLPVQCKQGGLWPLCHGNVELRRLRTSINSLSKRAQHDRRTPRMQSLHLIIIRLCRKV